MMTWQTKRKFTKVKQLVASGGGSLNALSASMKGSSCKPGVGDIGRTLSLGKAMGKA